MNKKFILLILLIILSILACGLLPDIPFIGGPDETTTPADPTPVAEVDAKTAIQTYAQDVLGIQISRLFAGGASGDVSLPLNLRDQVELAVDLAGTTYFGVWSGGIASLSFGDSDISGDFVADVRDGSLGVFALNVIADPPGDPNAALDLIRETYPGLRGYQWVEIPSENGYAFTTGQADDLSIQSWSVQLTGTTINAGVTPGLLNNQSFVWVVVASGVLAAPFQQ